MTDPKKMAEKRKKTYHFHDEWEVEFFFTTVKGACVCLICGATVATAKRHNVERHFTTCHTSYHTNYPQGSALQKEKSALCKQQAFFTKPVKASQKSTEASFRATQFLIKKKAAFSDGEVIKEAMMLIAITVLEDEKYGTDAISNLSDVQLGKGVLVEKKVPLEKLVSVTTDGAPAMIGRHTGFIAHCKGDTEFPNFLHYHYIIHQQALCAKVIGFEHLMTAVVKIINSIRSRAKQHRTFKVLLEELSTEYGDLLLHIEIRWLSRGQILLRFFVTFE